MHTATLDLLASLDAIANNDIALLLIGVAGVLWMAKAMGGGDQ